MFGNNLWSKVHSNYSLGINEITNSNIKEYGKAIFYFKIAKEAIEKNWNIFQKEIASNSSIAEYFYELYILLLYKIAYMKDKNISNIKNSSTNEYLKTTAKYLKGKKNHYLYLASTLFEFGEFDRSFHWCNEGLALNNDNCYLHELVLRINKELGNKMLPVASITFFKQTNHICPDFFSCRGNVYMMQDDYSCAIRDYISAIHYYSVNSNNKQLCFLRKGDVHMKLGEYVKAINDYTLAINLNNKNPIAFYNRGAAYTEISDRVRSNNNKRLQYLQAIKDYTAAINLNAQYWEPFYGRADANTMLLSYTKAMPDYEKALELIANTQAQQKCMTIIMIAVCLQKINGPVSARILTKKCSETVTSYYTKGLLTQGDHNEFMTLIFDLNTELHQAIINKETSKHFRRW